MSLPRKEGLGSGMEISSVECVDAIAQRNIDVGERGADADEGDITRRAWSCPEVISSFNQPVSAKPELGQKHHMSWLTSCISISHPDYRN